MLKVIQSSSVLLALLASASVVSAAETFIGSARYISPGNASKRAVELPASAPSIYAGVNFPVPAGLKFSGLTTLSTDYEFTVGSCMLGSPRFQVEVFEPSSMSNKNIFVYIGPPPNYTLCPPNVWTNSGNLLDPADLIDTGQLTGGTFYDPVATAVTKYGTYSVVSIQFIVDPYDQTVLIDNVKVNTKLYTFEPPPDDAIQVRYSSNLTSGDSLINFTNTGANGASLYGPGYGDPTGNLCVNVYAFSPDEQLVSCCSCLVTPNGLVHLTANNDLVNNTLTGVRPNSITIKLVATAAGPNFSGTSCSNSAAQIGSENFPLASGLLAWGTTLHSASGAEQPAGPFSITETPFSPVTLNQSELDSIRNRCVNIIGNGSTFGQCGSCRLGGLGGSKL